MFAVGLGRSCDGEHSLQTDVRTRHKHDDVRHTRHSVSQCPRFVKHNTLHLHKHDDVRHTRHSVSPCSRLVKHNTLHLHKHDDVRHMRHSVSPCPRLVKYNTLQLHSARSCQCRQTNPQDNHPQQSTKPLSQYTNECKHSRNVLRVSEHFVSATVS